MKKTIAILLALALALMSLCSMAIAEAGIPDTSGIAAESDMADVEDIVPEGMQPVTPDMLNDGTYAVQVDSSSSMFKITGCDLTVKDGAMTAVLYMKSEAYQFMFPDTAQAASEAAYEDLVALEALDDGRYAFTLPVDALDAGYTCAAFSARKQLWYPRTLLFHADSLPLEAWKTLTTAETLGLADGTYRCDAAITGGGKATVASPAQLVVENGTCTAVLQFSTEKIDYVIVDGTKYEPTATEGGATFTVPVGAFDVGLSIVVDSTAITPAVEVGYTLRLDSASIQAE